MRSLSLQHINETHLFLKRGHKLVALPFQFAVAGRLFFLMRVFPTRTITLLAISRPSSRSERRIIAIRLAVFPNIFFIAGQISFTTETNYFQHFPMKIHYSASSRSCSFLCELVLSASVDFKSFTVHR